MDSPYLEIPDAVSYNHYFGWYGGSTDMNGPWFDKFHEMHPTLSVGCSEYGCEALNWHSDAPQQGDYKEGYFSLNNLIADIMQASQGRQIILELLASVSMGGKGDLSGDFR